LQQPAQAMGTWILDVLSALGLQAVAQGCFRNPHVQGHENNTNILLSRKPLLNRHHYLLLTQHLCQLPKSESGIDLAVTAIETSNAQSL